MKALILLLFFISALAILTPYVSIAISYLPFYPQYPERLALIEQLLNNAVNYYAIIIEHGKPPQELIWGYEKEYNDVMRTLSTDRYVISPFSDIEKAGIRELKYQQELINAQIKLLKAKKLW